MTLIEHSDNWLPTQQDPRSKDSPLEDSHAGQERPQVLSGLGSKTVAGPGWAVAEDFQSSIAASVLFCLLYHQLEK